jgi:hypothetical protein
MLEMHRSQGASVPSETQNHDEELRDSFADITKVALARLELLEANQEASIPLLLSFGETAWKAKKKKVIPHGQFKSWCENVLNRSAMWVSNHRRLWEQRADLDLALAWARTARHPSAECRSVEKLLKIMADWRNALKGVGPTPVPAGRSRISAKRIIANLQQRLREDDEDFKKLQDPLSSEVRAKVVELAQSTEPAARQELESIAIYHHWRLRDLVGLGQT